jgi:nicotinamidase-related amidase
VAGFRRAGTQHAPLDIAYEERQGHRRARDRDGLLLIDVINDLAFEGSAALVALAEPMASRLAALKRRTSAAGVPAIYINDNFGQWRSDFRKTVAHCTARSSPGRLVSQRLKPTARDYFVLKPKHSGFYDTTLDTLLGALRSSRDSHGHRGQHLRPLHGE